MPVIESTYAAPWWLPGAHAQTVFSRLFRRVARTPHKRLRIETPDDDFLEIDLARATPHDGRLVILSHGLEGDSEREYIWGMAGAFLREGWSTLAWNYRSCGGTPNRQPRLYHCADIDDIATVIAYAVSLGYTRILLVGFSMGGNIVLRYLGAMAGNLPAEVLGGITFSVPCDLADSSTKLNKGFSKVYRWIFVRSLKNKVRQKSKTHPEVYSAEGLGQVKTLPDFDNMYTSRIHGFRDANDYYTQASCKYMLDRIDRPALIVNALNDPFLSPECFPYATAEKNKHLYLETPAEGGHVGFVGKSGARGMYWSEMRALEFAREHFG
jgi:predicted alpha/beta-fold hydrolase